MAVICISHSLVIANFAFILSMEGIDPCLHDKRNQCDSGLERRWVQAVGRGRMGVCGPGGNASEGYLYAGGDDADEVAWYIGNSGGIFWRCDVFRVSRGSEWLSGTSLMCRCRRWSSQPPACSSQADNTAGIINPLTTPKLEFIDLRQG